MNNGCSAFTQVGSQVSGCPLTTSSHHLSRGVCIGTLLPVRRYTITLRTPSQPPIANASSTTGLSGISLPPRNWPSAVMTSVAPASMIRSCRLLAEKAAEHDRVSGSNARAGLHRNHDLDRHRHVDQDAVAFLDAVVLQRIRELADFLVQVAVGDLRDGAVVGLEDDRDLVGVAVGQIAIEAVVRGVQLTVGEPLVEGSVRLVEDLSEGLGPVDVLARQACPRIP